MDKKDEPARQSEALARRSLNALAVTSSIVNALVKHPGPSGDHDEMVNAAKSMLGQADEMATRLMSRLDLESVPWARYRLMRMTTEAVSNRWISTSQSGQAPNADISPFMTVWREMSKHDLPTFQFENPSEDERVMMQISLLDAMQPVLQEITAFDLFHDPVRAAMHARDQIVKAANESVAEILPDNTSRLAHSQLLQSLLRNAGSVYAANWRRFSQDVIDFLEPLSVQRQEQEVASRPDGWPLNEVDAGFLSTYEKLTDMVAFLAHPPQALANESEIQMPNTSKNTSKNSTNSGLNIYDAVDFSDEPYEAPQWADDGPEIPSEKEFDEMAEMAALHKG